MIIALVKDFLHCVLKGAIGFTLGLIAVVLSGIIVIGPPIFATGLNNPYYLLWYIPHVMILLYCLGKIYND